MQTYIITAPNGKKYKVTGETREGAVAALRKMLGDAPQNASPNIDPAMAAAFDPAVVGTGQTRATPPARDTWTDTAAEMASGPWESAKAFGASLASGGQNSPSLRAIAADPVLGELPGPMQAALGFGGDVLGGGLSLVGAGLSGAAGFGTEFIPGLTPREEERFGGDILGMSQFAIPELAGGSSVVGRAATAAPKAAPVETQMAKDVAAARERNIPVFRTDVKPPETFVGKTAQKTGEVIPIAGTGGMRAGQQEARVEAVRNMVREYGADVPESVLGDVTKDVLEKHEATLKEFGGKKTAIVNSLKAKGAVPVPGAVAEIDRQIAALKAQKLPELEAVISRLEGWKKGIQGQPLDILEKNRQDIGQMFTDPALAGVKTRGEKAINAVYDPLRKDIAAYVKTNAGDEALATWNEANGRISAAMSEAKESTFKRVLNKGEATPETVKAMLFSQKPSDVARLYKSLTPEGQAVARTAVLQEVLGKAGGLEALSPDKFAAALGRLGPQIKTFFRESDFEAVDGLIRALALTKHAAEAKVFVPTGVQNFGTIMAAGLGSVLGFKGAVGAGAGIGLAARAYEATGVQRALRLMAKKNSPETQAVLLKQLDEALKDAGIPLGETAAQAANDPYEGLWQRYGK